MFNQVQVSAPQFVALPWEQKRAALFCAAELHSRIRKAVSDYGARKFEGLTGWKLAVAIAQTFSDHPGTKKKVRRFLTGEKSYAMSEMLRSLSAVVGMEQEFAKMTREVEKLQNAQLAGIISLPVPTVRLFTDVFEAFEASEGRANLDIFTTCFGSLSGIVRSALKCDKGALIRLAQEPAATKVRQVLSQQPWNKGSTTVVQKDVPAPTNDLQGLLKRLLKSHSQNSIAKRLGLHFDTVGGIISGRPAKHRDDKVLLEKARVLYGSELDNTQVTCPPPANYETVKAKVSEEPKFLLTPDTFTAHKLELGEHYVHFASSSIETARRLLDLAAQHDDADVRQRIQDVLTPEVQELYLAIKRFSAAHPNQLNDVFAAESAGFALDRKSRTSKKR